MKENTFIVSIIIPVYNAAEYLRRAVESAVHFDCVKEIFLVEDGSSDDSLAICTSLAREFEVVEVLQHVNGENCGAGKSRNLGIQHATMPYVAFLDADDFYLPNRFRAEQSILPDTKFNCVVGFTNCSYDSSAAKSGYQGVENKGIIYTGEQRDFWLYQSPTGHAGTFTTNAITVEKNLLEKVGLFDPSLKVSQDTELWIRLGIVGNFYFSGPEPIATRYVYVGNRSRVGAKIRYYRPLLYLRLLENIKYVGLTRQQHALFSFFLLIHLVKNIRLLGTYSKEQKNRLLSSGRKSILPVLSHLRFITYFFLVIRPGTKLG